MPERDGENLYNTCVAFSPAGEIMGKYRKMHLFDIDIPGGITFKESDTLSAGNSLTILGKLQSRRQRSSVCSYARIRLLNIFAL